MNPLPIAAGLLVLAVAAGAYHWRRHRVADLARVKVTGVQLTCSGAMLDVRYQVKRPGRLLAPKDEIYVIGPGGQRVAQVMSVVKIGRLATRRASQRSGGYLLLRNTASLSRGDRVRVVIGRQRQECVVG
jgi:hypothetical protein